MARLSNPTQVLDSIRDCVITDRTEHEATKLDPKKIGKTPILLAAFSETLRLHAPGAIVREVEHDARMLVDKKPYLLEKGSYLFFPLDCIHKDPEIHQNPMEFQVDRFRYLYSKSTPTPRFEKRGVLIQRGLVAFGGGVFQVGKLLPCALTGAVSGPTICGKRNDIVYIDDISRTRDHINRRDISAANAEVPLITASGSKYLAGNGG
jgi:Cytochrome P450